jgi:hypothetical protein
MKWILDSFLAVGIPKTTNPTHKETSANINDIHARGRTFPPRR